MPEHWSRVKVEVAVLGSPPLISLVVSVDVEHRERKIREETTELRSCVKVEMTVLGSPSQVNLMVSCGRKSTLHSDSGGRCGTHLTEEPIKELGRASGSPKVLARMACCLINIELTVKVTEDRIRQVLPSASWPCFIGQGRSLVLHGVLLQVLTGFWEFGRTVCKLGPFTTQLSVTASSLTLCCIAFDRYVAVVHPLQLSTMQVRRNAS